jgi:hypothetical protein
VCGGCKDFKIIVTTTAGEKFDAVRVRVRVRVKG